MKSDTTCDAIFDATTFAGQVALRRGNPPRDVRGIPIYHYWQAQSTVAQTSGEAGLYGLSSGTAGTMGVLQFLRECNIKTDGYATTCTVSTAGQSMASKVWSGQRSACIHAFCASVMLLLPVLIDYGRLPLRTTSPTCIRSSYPLRDFYSCASSTVCFRPQCTTTTVPLCRVATVASLLTTTACTTAKTTLCDMPRSSVSFMPTWFHSCRATCWAT